jgi:hypothetical protein
MEKYIILNRNRSNIQCITRLRIGAHRLRIERGRYGKNPLFHAQRICLHCLNKSCIDNKATGNLDYAVHTHFNQVKYTSKQYKYEQCSVSNSSNILTWTVGVMCMPCLCLG